MDISLEQHNEDISLIRFKGFLDFETSLCFEKNHLSEAVNGKKVIFEFSQLEFVGSCGLISFVQTLYQFCRQHQPRPRFVGVNPEFVKFMEARGFGSDDFYESMESAVNSYHYSFNPQKRLNPSFF